MNAATNSNPRSLDVVARVSSLERRCEPLRELALGCCISLAAPGLRTQAVSSRPTIGRVNLFVLLDLTWRTPCPRSYLVDSEADGLSDALSAQGKLLEMTGLRAVRLTRRLRPAKSMRHRGYTSPGLLCLVVRLHS